MTSPAPTVVLLFIPGAIVNPQASARGGTWHKRARLARSIRQRVCMNVLAVVGRRPPWPAAAAKLVTLTAYVQNKFDQDNLRWACKPYVDALKDMRIIDDDRDSCGHTFTYQQEVSRGKGADLGVEIEVALA